VIPPAVLFRDGGPFMWLVLLLGVVYGFGALAYCTLAVRRRAPAWIVLLPWLVILLFGVLGTQVGMTLAVEALARASPETRTVLLSHGLGVSTFPMLGSLWAVAAPLATAALGAWIGVFTRGSEAHPASARGSATLLTLALLGTAIWFELIMSRASALGFVGYASPEGHLAIVSSAQERAVSTVWWGLGAMVGVFVVGGGSTALSLRRASRSVATELGAGALLVIFALSTPMLAVSSRVGMLAHLDELRRLDDPMSAIDDLDIDLALPTARECVHFRPGNRMSVGRAELRIDGVWVGEPAGRMRDGMHWGAFEALDRRATGAMSLIGDGPEDFSGQLNVDVGADVRWSELRPLVAAASGARFGVMRLSAVRPPGHCQVVVDLVGPPHPSAGTRRPSADPSRPPGDRFANLAPERPGQDVVARIEIGAEVPPPATVVELVPPPDLTVQQLVHEIERIRPREVALVVQDGPVLE